MSLKVGPPLGREEMLDALRRQMVTDLITRASSMFEASLHPDSSRLVVGKPHAVVMVEQGLARLDLALEIMNSTPLKKSVVEST